METEVSRREDLEEGSDRPEHVGGSAAEEEPSSLKEWACQKAQELRDEMMALNLEWAQLNEKYKQWFQKIADFEQEVGKGTETLKEVRRYVHLAQQQFKTYRIGPESILGQLLDRAKEAADAELEAPE